MRSLLVFGVLLGCAAGMLRAQVKQDASAPLPQQQAPAFKGEVLNYSVNWPSGLSLGEGRMGATKAGDRWEFEFSLEAAVPGVSLKDRFRSIAVNEYCSLEFEKDFTNGKRKARERTTFDRERSVATRATLDGGGKSEIPVPACARDALGFIFYLRHELSQGRLPPAQTVFFGAPYHVRLDYGGTQNVRVGDSMVQADRLTASVKGPASEFALEMFFARDAVRTPVLVRAPFPLGTFSLELVR